MPNELVPNAVTGLKDQMPNELVPNAITGYLEPGGAKSFSGFSSDKKVKFLELSSQIAQEKGIIPNLNHICAAVGIEMTTFYNHLKADEKFNLAWKQCLLNVEAHLQSKMSEFAMRPGNYMDRITALRRIAPERWNPDHKITVQHDVNVIKQIAGEAEKIIETTATEITSTQDEQSINQYESCFT